MKAVKEHYSQSDFIVTFICVPGCLTLWHATPFRFSCVSYLCEMSIFKLPSVADLFPRLEHAPSVYSRKQFEFGTEFLAVIEVYHFSQASRTKCSCEMKYTDVIH